MITCKNCLEVLYPYIDRELSDDDVEQVRKHLDACRGCLHLFEFEASIRRLVRVRCKEQMAPEHLKVRILQVLEVERLRYERRHP